LDPAHGVFKAIVEDTVASYSRAVTGYGTDPNSARGRDRVTDQRAIHALERFLHAHHLDIAVAKACRTVPRLNIATVAATAPAAYLIFT
jgi:hypothetical protein